MHLLTLGLNHRTAAVDLRERTAFSPEQLPDAVRSLTASSDVAEATILSTCNRTEIYCRQENPASAPVLDWLRDYGDLPSDVLNSSTYALRGEQAVQHAFRVASGLDSMVLGETEILGQLKACVRHEKRSHRCERRAVARAVDVRLGGRLRDRRADGAGGVRLCLGRQHASDK